MAKKMDLCGRCAALMMDACDLHKVSGGVNNKVTCAYCGKRRYGGSYEVQPKRNTGKDR